MRPMTFSEWHAHTRMYRQHCDRDWGLCDVPTTCSNAQLLWYQQTVHNYFQTVFTVRRKLQLASVGESRGFGSFVERVRVSCSWRQSCEWPDRSPRNHAIYCATTYNLPGLTKPSFSHKMNMRVLTFSSQTVYMCIVITCICSRVCHTDPYSQVVGADAWRAFEIYSL